MIYSFLTSALITVIIFSTTISIAQVNPDSLMHIEVLGNTTDPWINGDIGKKHQVFYNPTSTSNNTLLLHMVGTIDNPNSTTYFPELATENGFHVINLMYRNWTSAQAACGDSTDPDCYLNFRKEIIEGVDYSDVANVNAANSIHNRLLKLLEYMTTNYPGQGWDQFYSGSSILWDKIMVSGHSQGGGHAAVIAMTEPVKRVLMFASPNDYSDTLNAVADWTGATHIVPDSNYYGFNALYDDVVNFSEQMEAWDGLGLDNLGDTVNVDISTSPYNGSRQLYTKQEVPSGGIEDLTHNIMIRDNQTPTDLSGTPVYLPVWKYMLGIEDPSNSITSSSLKTVNVFPNPAAGTIRINIEATYTTLKVKLFDTAGKLCYSASNQTIMHLDHLNKGVYLLELTLDGVPSGHQKIVLE